MPAPVALVGGGVVAQHVLLAQLGEDLAEDVARLLDPLDGDEAAAALADRLLEAGDLAVMAGRVAPGGRVTAEGAEADPVDQRLAVPRDSQHFVHPQQAVDVYAVREDDHHLLFLAGFEQLQR